MVEPRQLGPQQAERYLDQYARVSRAASTTLSVVDSVLIDLIPHIEWLNRQRADTARELGLVEAELAELRKQHDDPSADLPGTVRISPGEITYVKRSDHDYSWFSITGATARRDVELVGWKRGTPVEGTPAAKAAAAVIDTPDLPEADCTHRLGLRCKRCDPPMTANILAALAVLLTGTALMLLGVSLRDNRDMPTLAEPILTIAGGLIFATAAGWLLLQVWAQLVGGAP